MRWLYKSFHLLLFPAFGYDICSNTLGMFCFRAYLNICMMSGERVDCDVSKINFGFWAAIFSTLPSSVEVTSPHVLLRIPFEHILRVIVNMWGWVWRTFIFAQTRPVIFHIYTLFILFKNRINIFTFLTSPKISLFITQRARSREALFHSRKELNKWNQFHY